MNRPAYFEPVRDRASTRWDQLEGEPDLAGPWHQLFKQVQSPRHVLSELLQNADDAGATEASVEVEGDEFVFSHNGEDFVEENFLSLCRFGYSNKRTLHTIGFRGIGFKSTFSLGDSIAVTTPTLSFRFDRCRFTQPNWLEADAGAALTRIEVQISTPQRRQELEKNLAEWKRSSASLLFFRNIETLDLADDRISRKVVGDGPVARSEWIELGGAHPARVLLVRSQEIPFPE